MLQLLFKIPQADWMRATHYSLAVSASNVFCESDNSTVWEIDTPL